MSLYNMLFGKNAHSPLLLKAIGLKENEVPRYRDCFIHNGKIVVHTRTGGRNRDDYEAENDALAANPHYLYDEDDDFDCTYANFYFNFPDEYKADLEALEKDSPNHTPSEKWQALFAAMYDAKPDVA